ncbi:MAG: hypothetical protein J5760_02555 [Clostridia bacterium]|nr:hypothetical protein [Clostridia bacterium]
MKKRMICLALAFVMIAALIPFGAIEIPAAAADDYSAFKTENVVVPEGWDYVEVSTVNELLATCERHGGIWSNDGQPMFVRLMADLEMKDRWVGRFNQACIFLGYASTTVIDFNGHRIDCDINAYQNYDNHTWYGLQIELEYGVSPDFYFRLVDSVGGGGVFLDAYTDIDGPTTAVMINGHCLYGYPSNATEEQVPYWKDGVRVYIDGGVYRLYSKNEKFCLVQSGPYHDSNGFARWGFSLTDVPYARSALAFDGVFPTVNNGSFKAIYPTDWNSVKDDMGRRFMSDLGLCDSQSACFLRINGGEYSGTCYSVYAYGNMSIYADDEKWMKKFDPMPVINGGKFTGGIQFCSTRTSFWRKLQGAYDLNPKMKDVKVSEILVPGAKMYMDGKLVDVNSKDLEDIAWPHDIIIEPGPQIIETEIASEAVAVNAVPHYLVQYNKTPDSVKLQEYITVIRNGKTTSYWTDDEANFYTLVTPRGENYYNFYIPTKNYATTGKYRVIATFGDISVTSPEIEVEFIDFSDFDFTYGPVWHDGNGEGVAYVDFDVSHRNAVKSYKLYWLVHGDYWQSVDGAPYLNQDYNNGKFRFYIPELADKDNDATTYCIIVTYEVGGVERNIYSDEHDYTEADLGAPMDPYDVELDCTECVLGVGESKTVYVTLYPTAAPHKEGFSVEYTNGGAIQIDAYNTAEEFFTFTAKAEGTCIITVTAEGGAYETCKVTVVGDPKAMLRGDMDRDGDVDSDDAIYLLRYTLFPVDYPILQDADFTKNGAEGSEDAIYLLRHTLFAADFPLD